jgi:hypothetical protein
MPRNRVYERAGVGRRVGGAASDKGVGKEQERSLASHGKQHHSGVSGVTMSMNTTVP